MTIFATPARAMFGLAALAALAACGGSEPSEPNTRPATDAEAACLRDVAEMAGTTDVTLMGNSLTADGILVQIGVGPDRAKWSCLARSDGSTSEIMSTTDEGAM
ncbi:hypothetical protein [Salipiger sp. PrR002]|uniref:hypothetical protein n=1 Tax=Salipiger sp. PrR002 TaxID=2706489 RepID=UPI0013BA1B7A|nr:hypothetical protein [Salipiger sp. PrR002]NDW02155.1 hypothetical protein [Salipiger sp. PrR002]NDW59160.1 hypothetical protein [Salipiger sp. PrR004]